MCVYKLLLSLLLRVFLTSASALFSFQGAEPQWPLEVTASVRFQTSPSVARARRVTSCPFLNIFQQQEMESE